MPLLIAPPKIFFPTCGTDPMNALKTIIKRIKEPSTWAGLAALGLIFGLPPGTVEALGQVLGGVAALAAIALPEKGGE